METPADFGTGLRAHLGLDELLEPAPAPAPCEELAVEPALELGAFLSVADPEPEPADDVRLAEEARRLAEREHELALREALLERRSAAVLAQAQALYDELHGDVRAPDDELAARRIVRAARPA